MSKTLGIDLGTTNSAMALVQGGSPKIITNAQGGSTTPSIVAETSDGERIVGTPAKNQAILNPENTLYSVKRLIGRSWDDKEVQKAKKNLPYEIRKDDKGGVEVKMGSEWYKPQQISAMVLQKIKQDAEQYLGEDITNAVITVPAYFDDSQRQATKDAGKIAGLNVERIVNEPTAAALAYGLDKNKEGTIAVFDLGGGTFDVSVLEVGDGVFEVLSTNGDTMLGGDDFDQAIIDMLVEEFKDKEGIDLTEDNTALQRLKEAAEKAKIELSQSQTTTINIPYITADENGPRNLMREMTRAEFEKITSELLDRLQEPCEKALKDAKMSKDDIDDIILVGGMTRMPAVKEIAKKVFGKEAKQDLNPDEVVALGAAIQGGVLSGDVTDITLLDVTPLSLGVETKGGVMTPLIERNTSIPVEKKQTFTTAAPNQEAVDVHVLQGERPMATDNKSLGQFRLEGIPPAPAGMPQIEVSFSIDANGILKVKAQDKTSGKEQQITITATTTLDDDEVEKLVEEAKKHADEDKKKKEKVETKNEADSLAFTAEKSLKDMKDNVKKDDKEKLEKMISEIRDLIAKDDFDTDEVKKKTEALSDELQKVAQAAYAKEDAEKNKTNEDKSKDEKESDKEGDSAKNGKNDKKDEDVKEGKVSGKDKKDKDSK